MAKRRTGTEAANPESGRTERARGTLGALGSGARLVSRMLPFVVAARRFRSPWSMVRSFQRASAAARRLDREVNRQAARRGSRESAPHERVRPALSLARAVQAGARPARILAADRASRTAGPLWHGHQAVASPAPRDDRSGRERERRVEHTRPRAPRRRRHEPDLAMADAVRHATRLDRVLAGRERYALGLSYGIHDVLERSLLSARRLNRGWAAGRDVMRVMAYRATAGSHEHDARARSAESSPGGAGHGAALSHFARALRVPGGKLKGATAHGVPGGRIAGARIPSHASLAISSAARVGSTRAAAPPFVLATPVATASEHRSRAAAHRGSGQVVINSSPTVVVNNAESTSDIEQRVLEALRKHRRALYEQWHRELDKRLRTEF